MKTSRQLPCVQRHVFFLFLLIPCEDRPWYSCAAKLTNKSWDTARMSLENLVVARPRPSESSLDVPFFLHVPRMVIACATVLILFLRLKHSRFVLQLVVAVSVSEVRVRLRVWNTVMELHVEQKDEYECSSWGWVSRHRDATCSISAAGTSACNRCVRRSLKVFQ